jgi:hypothetical protein
MLHKACRLNIVPCNRYAHAFRSFCTRWSVQVVRILCEHSLLCTQSLAAQMSLQGVLAECENFPFEVVHISRIHHSLCRLHYIGTNYRDGIKQLHNRARRNARRNCWDTGKKRRHTSCTAASRTASLESPHFRVIGFTNVGRNEARREASCAARGGHSPLSDHSVKSVFVKAIHSCCIAVLRACNDSDSLPKTARGRCNTRTSSSGDATVDHGISITGGLRTINRLKLLVSYDDSIWQSLHL